ncbi:translation initiation factor IF-3 [bacterium]|nr:translation initiation factor IF-3 [bacterium]MDE6223994.1 translation initiation factor IF-3 [Alphaproteobacteria bacterium]
MANKDNGISLNVNEKIRAKEVRLIGADGENVGIVSISSALNMARDAGLDLLEIAPQSNPPVCKIMDYGKWKYEEQKKLKEAKSNQKVVETKELKIRPNIDVHDFQVKMKSAKRFIEDGDKVKFSVRFKGREITNQESGLSLLNRVKEELGDIIKVDKEPLMEGRQMVMFVSPSK